MRCVLGVRFRQVVRADRYRSGRRWWRRARWPSPGPSRRSPPLGRVAVEGGSACAPPSSPATGCVLVRRRALPARRGRGRGRSPPARPAAGQAGGGGAAPTAGWTCVVGDEPGASTDSRTFGPVAPPLGPGPGRAAATPRRGAPGACHGRRGHPLPSSSWTGTGSSACSTPAAVDDVTDLPMEELRKRRAEGQELEVGGQLPAPPRPGPPRHRRRRAAAPRRPARPPSTTTTSSQQLSGILGRPHPRPRARAGCPSSSRPGPSELDTTELDAHRRTGRC